MTTPWNIWIKNQKNIQYDILQKLIKDPVAFSKNVSRYTNNESNIKNICCIFNKEQKNTGTFCNKRNVDKLTTDTYLIEMLDGSQIKVIGDLYQNVKQKGNISTSLPGKGKNVQYEGMNRIADYYLGLDEFTNEMLINYLINLLWKPVGLPHMNYELAGSVVCKNSGLNIYPLAFSNLSGLPPGFKDRQLQIEKHHVDNIIRQVAIALHFLQGNIGFVHGNLILDNILETSERTKFNYEGIEVDGDFRILISNLGVASSSIIAKHGLNIRLFNQSPLASTYLLAKPFIPDVDDEGVYQIKGLNSHLYTRIRHMGLPWFKGFDFYTLIVSLMVHKDYYEVIRRDFSWLYNNIIWDEKDLKTLRKRIDDNYGNTDYDTILNILKGLNLYDDVLDICLEFLRDDFPTMRPARQPKYLSKEDLDGDFVSSSRSSRRAPY